MLIEETVTSGIMRDGPFGKNYLTYLKITWGYIMRRLVNND